MTEPITIDRKVLADELRFVSRVAPARPIRPTVGCVRMESTGQALSLACTDTETITRSRIEAEGERWLCAVSASRLQDFVTSVHADTIKLSLEGPVLVVSAESAKCRLIVDSILEFPDVSMRGGEDICGLPMARFAAMVPRLAPSAQERGRFSSSVARMTIRGQRACFATANSHTMAYCTESVDFASKDDPAFVCYPPWEAILVARHLGVAGDLIVSESDRGMDFECLGRSVSCRKYEASFPNVDHVLQASEFDLGYVVDREQVRVAMSVAAKAAGEFMRARWDAGDDGIFVCAESPLGGVRAQLFAEEVPGGDGFRVHINPTYAAMAAASFPGEKLRFCAKEFVRIEGEDEHSSAVSVISRIYVKESGNEE